MLVQSDTFKSDTESSRLNIIGIEASCSRQFQKMKQGLRVSIVRTNKVNDTVSAGTMTPKTMNIDSI